MSECGSECGSEEVVVVVGGKEKEGKRKKIKD
jgi:hypothetical protein